MGWEIDKYLVDTQDVTIQKCSSPLSDSTFASCLEFNNLYKLWRTAYTTFFNLRKLVTTFSSCSYLIFVICFTRAKFLENKIYTEKTRKLRQNTQKIANFLRYYGKIHSKLPIFRVKSVKIYTGQFFLHRHRLWCL